MSKKIVPLLWGLLLVGLVFVLIETSPYYGRMFTFARMLESLLFMVFTGLVLGLLLGAERAILQAAPGRWQFNFTRVVVAWLPWLVISVVQALRLTPWSMRGIWVDSLTLFAGIGLGYLLTSSMTRGQESQKKLFPIFIWSTVSVLVLYGLSLLEGHIDLTSPRSLPVEIAGLAFGILLGLERVLFGKPGGSWRFNYVRLLLAGLPLMLVLLYVWELLPIAQTLFTHIFHVRLVKILTTVSLGYVLVTSLERSRFPGKSVQA